MRIVGRIVVLLPYFDAGTMERTFNVHASGRVKKTRGLPLRQQSSATRIPDAVRMLPLGVGGSVRI